MCRWKFKNVYEVREYAASRPTLQPISRLCDKFMAYSTVQAFPWDTISTW
jgi:hypothetical protein